jgi:NAD(P)H-flavin reductase
VIKSWKKSAPRLLYSVGSAEEENYPLQKELENLKNSNQLNLTVCTDREKWEQLAFSQFEGLNPSFCQILICGPNSYMDCCLALANSKNINRKNVFAFGFDDH